ncbi:MAG TPA: four helix bundle protein [Vicinamibacterales bacterium]|nr:four helix bundle protein [Vicinamibacterales bacterium]
MLTSESMNAEQLRKRSRRFAIAIVHLCRRLPADRIVRTIGGQLLRSGTGVAANYRASCRARSDKEFCAKIGIVAEESDESQLWLELLSVASTGIDGKEHDELLKEAGELTAIFSASYATARQSLNKKKRRKREDEASITKLPSQQMTRSP